MFVRFGFLYSCFMVVAGSSLLAELPFGETAPAQPVAAAGTDEIQPTLAKPKPKAAAIQQTAAVAPAEESPELVRQLEEKQHEMKALQREIDLLQSRLGIAKAYKVDCMLAEVNLVELHKLDPEIQWDDQRLSVVELLEFSKSHATVTTQQFRAIQTCLEATGTMKTWMALSAVVHLGEPVALIRDRQAVSGKDGNMEQALVGDVFLTTLSPIGNGAVKVRVQQSPALTFQGARASMALQASMNVTTKLQPGTTSLHAALPQEDTAENSGEKTQEDTLFLTAISVSKVEPLEATAPLELVTEGVTLQPIPYSAPVVPASKK